MLVLVWQLCWCFTSAIPPVCLSRCLVLLVGTRTGASRSLKQCAVRGWVPRRCFGLRWKESTRPTGKHQPRAGVTRQPGPGPWEGTLATNDHPETKTGLPERRVRPAHTIQADK